MTEKILTEEDFQKIEEKRLAWLMQGWSLTVTSPTYQPADDIFWSKLISLIMISFEYCTYVVFNVKK